MKQYCRYCAYCFEAEGYFCSNHPKGEQPYWTENDIKKVNHCPNFALTDDVITGRQYKPREYKPKNHESESQNTEEPQLSFFD